MVQNTPTKLYKYQAINKHSIQNLKHGQVWFSKPEKLNDPFDCAIPFTFNWTDDDLILFYDSQYNELKNQNKNTTVPHHIDFFFDNGRPNQRYKRFVDNLQKDLSIQLHNRISQLGIACFTEKKDDILMWSNYANSHKGFCIEFDTSYAPFHTLNALQKVVYDSKYPSLSPVAILKSKGIPDDVLKTKSTRWEYENEWRLVTVKGNTALEYDPKALTAIYFGCSMSEKYMRQISILFTNSNIQLFKMQRSKTDFSLIPVPYK